MGPKRNAETLLWLGTACDAKLCRCVLEMSEESREAKRTCTWGAYAVMMRALVDTC